MIDKAIQLRRVLSLWNCICYIICAVIGAGIFVVPKQIFLSLNGSLMACMALWAGCGIVNIVLNLCYLELALTFPESGCDFVYVREAFGDFISFLVMWIQVCFRRVANKAALALSFATYLCGIVWTNDCEPPIYLTRLIATLTISFLGFINAYNTRFPIMTASITTYAKLMGLISITFSGLAYMALGHTSDNADVLEHDSSAEIGFYIDAFLLCYWAYFGGSSIYFFIEEVKTPVGRNLMLATVISSSVIIGLYVMTNFAILSVLSPTELLISDAVAVTFGVKVFSIANWLIPAMVTISIFGTMNFGIAQDARIVLTSARNGHMPKIMTLIHVERRTPIAAVMFTSMYAIVMVNFSGLYTLLRYIAYALILIVSLSLWSLAYLRVKKPELKRPFKMPLWIILLQSLFCLVLVIYPFYSNPFQTCICLSFILTGVPVYFILVKPRQLPKLCVAVDVAFTRFVQKLVLSLVEEGQLENIAEI